MNGKRLNRIISESINRILIEKRGFFPGQETLVNIIYNEIIEKRTQRLSGKYFPDNQFEIDLSGENLWLKGVLIRFTNGTTLAAYESRLADTLVFFDKKNKEIVYHKILMYIGPNTITANVNEMKSLIAHELMHAYEDYCRVKRDKLKSKWYVPKLGQTEEDATDYYTAAIAACSNELDYAEDIVRVGERKVMSLNGCSNYTGYYKFTDGMNGVNSEKEEDRIKGELSYVFYALDKKEINAHINQWLEEMKNILQHGRWPSEEDAKKFIQERSIMNVYNFYIDKFFNRLNNMDEEGHKFVLDTLAEMSIYKFKNINRLKKYILRRKTYMYKKVKQNENRLLKYANISNSSFG